MPQAQPITELNAAFSQPDSTAPPWDEVAEVLSTSEMFWLSTVRRDGRPHVTPIPAIWLDGTLYFCTGSQEQKAVNLRSNLQAVGTTGFEPVLSAPPVQRLNQAGPRPGAGQEPGQRPSP